MTTTTRVRRVRAGRRHRQIAQLLADQTEVYGSALTSRVYPDGKPYLNFGNLPFEYRRDMELDRERHGITFIVYSYSTPIAWRRGDGNWIKPSVKYSVTTSMHQGCLYLCQ